MNLGNQSEVAAETLGLCSVLGEKEVVPQLSLLIEIKEFQEKEDAHRGFGEEDAYDSVKHVLFRILKNYPLNGRSMDTRYEMRKTAMKLLSLFFRSVVFRDKDTIKTYLQT